MNAATLGNISNVYHSPYDSRSLARSAYAEWAMVKICFLVQDTDTEERYLGAAIAYAERAGMAAWGEHETISPLIADVSILEAAWREGYESSKDLPAAEAASQEAAEHQRDTGPFDGYGAETDDEADEAFRLNGAIICAGANCGVKLLCVYGADKQPKDLVWGAFDDLAPLQLRALDSALLMEWPAPAEGWTLAAILATLNSVEAVAVATDVTDAYVGAVWIGSTEI